MGCYCLLKLVGVSSLTKLCPDVVEEKKDEAIEAQKEKAKEQIDDYALNNALAAQP